MNSKKTNPSGHGYCGTLTDQQVQNVYTDEKKRVATTFPGGEIHEAAKELRDEAMMGRNLL